MNINYVEQFFSFKNLKTSPLFSTQFNSNSGILNFKISINDIEQNCIYDTAAANFNIISIKKIGELIPDYKEIETEQLLVCRPDTDLYLFKIVYNLPIKIGGSDFLINDLYYFKEDFDNLVFNIESKIDFIFGNNLFINGIVTIDYKNNKFEYRN